MSVMIALRRDNKCGWFLSRKSITRGSEERANSTFTATRTASMLQNILKRAAGDAPSCEFFIISRMLQSRNERADVAH